MQSDPFAETTGEADSLDALLRPAAYARLRAIAAGARRRLPSETLNTTALVSEAYLRMAESRLRTGKDGPLDRAGFFALFASVVRNTLIDHLRARSADKRSGQHTTLSHAGALAFDAEAGARLLAVDAALERLRDSHPRLVQVVEMRFFAGYDNHEIAGLLGLNEKTVRRDWLQARALLAEALDDA
ncbi:MAG: ECF-type sigma factor [Aquimonas sp.]|nr:ECF-type sigma factor [Aquimonas sp.]